MIGTLAASVPGDRRETVPLRAVKHVYFDDDEVIVVHESDDDEDEITETEVRPRSDEARADAALALRLRGVDVRGGDEDDAVSPAAIDAPKTELLE